MTRRYMLDVSHLTDAEIRDRMVPLAPRTNREAWLNTKMRYLQRGFSVVVSDLCRIRRLKQCHDC